MPFVYSTEYFVEAEDHVFPIRKYGLIASALKNSGIITPNELIEPKPAKRSELLLVHSEEYLCDLDNLRHTVRTITSELPLTRELLNMSVLMAGGTIETVRLAIEAGWCIHIGGGFHHAFPGRAEGFCYINDLAVAVRFAMENGWVERIAVIDCDLHQGNGTAMIFQKEESVFTYSIHQQDIYPVKERSDLDVSLPAGTDDELYMQKLRDTIAEVFSEFKPELVIYQGGADPFEGDQLGDLMLTKKGLYERDNLVFSIAADAGIPVAITLGGGYAIRTTDTVDIHLNTCKACIETFNSYENGEKRTS